MGEHFTFWQKNPVILHWSQQFEKGFQLLKVPNLGRKCWKTSLPVAQIEGCEVRCLSDRGIILELMYVWQREYTGRYYQVLATLACLSHLDSHEYKAKCSMHRCASTACGVECYFKCNFMLGMSMANVWGCFCFALNDSLYYLFLTLFILGRNPLLCYLSLITVRHAKCSDSFSVYVITLLIFFLYSHPFRLLRDTVAAYCFNWEGSDQNHQEQQKPRVEWSFLL